MNRIVTFETTHHALWAEQVAEEKGLGVQVVAAPKESGSQCGMALEALPEDLDSLTTALDELGIVYRLFP
jgi:hypothetical protein